MEKYFRSFFCFFFPFYCHIRISYINNEIKDYCYVYIIMIPALKKKKKKEKKKEIAEEIGTK